MIVEVMGTSVRVEAEGSGAPCLLLHGWGGSAESWLPVRRDFADAMRLYSLDFPGHGASSEPPVPWGVPEYTQMTQGVLDALGVERCDIVAHSFGARVAILLAAEHPQRVRRMILTGAAGLRAVPSLRQKMRSKLYKGLRSAADSGLSKAILGESGVARLEDGLRRQFGSRDYNALSPSMRATFSRIISQDLTADLPRIKASTLLVWGREDTETPLWMGETMEKQIPDAGLVVFEGCGHFAYLDQYPRFQTIMRQFLIG